MSINHYQSNTFALTRILNEVTVDSFTKNLDLFNAVGVIKTEKINCKINEFNFTKNSNTLATIYIVRDPRNLVNSISNHYDKSVTEAKEFLLTPKTYYSSVDLH